MLVIAACALLGFWQQVSSNLDKNGCSMHDMNMPAQCAVTGVTYKKVKKRSKSMHATNTRVRANLQRVKIGNKRIKISARALRTLRKKMEMQPKRKQKQSA